MWNGPPCSGIHVSILSFLAVLKRNKAKKGKNDLISAEEGEDPFADISSVGTAQQWNHLWPSAVVWSSADLYETTSVTCPRKQHPPLRLCSFTLVEQWRTDDKRLSLLTVGTVRENLNYIFWWSCQIKMEGNHLQRRFFFFVLFFISHPKYWVSPPTQTRHVITSPRAGSENKCGKGQLICFRGLRPVSPHPHFS